MKQAFWLVKFELKHSPLTILLLIGILLISLLLVSLSLPEYMEEPSMGMDIFFILFFSIVSQWARPKEFREQKLGNSRYASYFLIALNQLPIRREILSTYRFLTFAILSIPFHISFLVILYILIPALRTEMTGSQYAVFCFFWICFSIYIGGMQLITEAGSDLIKTILLSLFLLGPIFFIVFIFSFYKLYPNGLVNWTMFVSIKYPVQVIICSSLLAILGWFTWSKRMQKKMASFDYL
ncbi:hypothetical protein ACLIBH_01870 [Virgibacillus sp. W0430]|uniref:hypothetical protein n=1 Tax=Virgibacillus sp. W0430 TaxID=3391580 RepID=UPI003F45CAD4